MTMMGSFGGGCFGLLFTLIKNKGKAEVMELINSVLGSLVSITAGCFLYRAWESLLIGFIGAAIASGTSPLFDMMGVDDPVGASAVHGACGLWGVLAVGLFADNPIPMETTNGRSGLFKGGGWYLLGVQSLTGVCLVAWGILVTITLLWCIDKIMPIRMDPYTELLGADITEHRIRHGQVGISRAVSALRPYHRSNSIEQMATVGMNTGHGYIVDKLNEAKKKNGLFHVFSNKAYVSDQEPTSSFTNQGFLHKRPGNTGNHAHSALDSMVHEINDTTLINKEVSNVIHVIPEEIKGKRYKDLSPKELAELGRISASQDRFRYRFHEDDYKKDVQRSATSNIRWLD
ncbi:unnamed protein product [Spodoptera exigua]|nr:unnamed protein product [Spodoptera exigua]